MFGLHSYSLPGLDDRALGLETSLKMARDCTGQGCFLCRLFAAHFCQAPVQNDPPHHAAPARFADLQDRDRAVRGQQESLAIGYHDASRHASEYSRHLPPLRA